MTRPVAEVLEDLADLDSYGVGATEAAERTDFPSAEAMEKWLDRHGHYAMWKRMKSRDPEGTHDNTNRRNRTMQAVEAPARDLIATLLHRGEQSPAARTRAKVKKIREALADLEAALGQDADREKARKEVQRLEAALRSARARLNGKPEPTGPSASDVRAWAKANDVECPAMGRVPTAVVEAFDAAHADEAASA